VLTPGLPFPLCTSAPLLTLLLPAWCTCSPQDPTKAGYAHPRGEVTPVWDLTHRGKVGLLGALPSSASASQLWQPMLEQAGASPCPPPTWNRSTPEKPETCSGCGSVACPFACPCVRVVHDTLPPRTSLQQGMPLAQPTPPRTCAPLMVPSGRPGGLLG